MQETRKPQKEEKRSLEKKDTENMEMKKLEEQAKNVETFNPRWHDGEYLGPNTLRQKAETEVYGKMEEEP